MRLWSLALAALAVVGLALTIAGGGTLDVIGFGLVGVAAVGGVSLAFFAVGRSEDRAREAETQARDPGPDAERPGDGRISSRRPPRSRGDS